MTHETIEIKVDYSKAGLKAPERIPELELYIPDVTGLFPDKTVVERPTVIIVPGGAYHCIAWIESDPIAIGFMNEGFNCAILKYSVAPSVFPAALMEVAKAVETVKTLGSDYGINKDKVFVCGFSAGGHLAASYSNFWNKQFLKDAVGLDGETLKISGTVLGYPVLTYNNGEHCHAGSFMNLLGDKFGDKEALDFVSLDKQVSEDTVPTFIMHTYEDKSVPIEGTLLYAQALRANDIPFELHIYKYGVHGIGTASRLVNHESRAKNWINMAAEWMLDIK